MPMRDITILEYISPPKYVIFLKPVNLAHIQFHIPSEKKVKKKKHELKHQETKERKIISNAIRITFSDWM